MPAASFLFSRRSFAFRLLPRPAPPVSLACLSYFILNLFFVNQFFFSASSATTVISSVSSCTSSAIEVATTLFLICFFIYYNIPLGIFFLNRNTFSLSFFIFYRAGIV
jgi:hypothetical protein